MRISIWQQFSSNHSGNFLVVGTFASPEAANKAADEVRSVLQRIQVWYRASENATIVEQLLEDQSENGGSPPMPIEVKIGNEYGFERATQAPDAIWYLESKDATEAVAVYENHLIFDHYRTRERTWFGGETIRRLVERVGGRAVLSDHLWGGSFWLKLTCIAPDEATAIQICQIYESVQKNDEAYLKSEQYPRIFIGNEMWGGVEREGERLKFALCEIGYLPDELTELIDYLQHKGCTQIEYSFESGRPE